LSLAVGRATLTYDFEERVVDGHSAVLIDTGVVHQWRIDDPFELWVIGITPGVLADGGRLVERLVSGGVVAIPPDEADDILAVARLAKRRFEDHPGDPHRSALFTHALLRQLADWAEASDPKPGPSMDTDDVVARFLAVISAAPGRRTVADIAADLGISPSHLATLVRDRTGQSPKQLMAGRSVLEAKRLLSKTTMSAAAVGSHLGFADASQFGRFFRDQTGRSPGQFRSELYAIDHPPEAESRSTATSSGPEAASSEGPAV
jgi:AraC-like DNA-binding protein